MTTQEHPHKPEPTQRQPARRQFVLAIRDEGDGDSVPVIHRLRLFLKGALRQWRLRCVRAVEVDGAGKELSLQTESPPDGEPMPERVP